MKRRIGLAVIATAALVATSFPSLAQEAGRDGVGELSEVDDAVSLESTFEVTPATADGQKLVSIIVDLDVAPVASYEGGVDGYAATSPQATGDRKLNANSPQARRYREFVADTNAAFAADLSTAIPGSEVTRSFELIVGGVSALVPRDDLDAVQDIAGVRAVYLDELHQLDTEVSPDFIGATQLWEDLGGSTEAGEGVIVGVVDSGIWPEHPSVADPDPSGTPYPEPPDHWQGSGTGEGCDFGNTAHNADDAPYECDNKLIGAYNFTDTYTAVVGLLPTEFDSARDSNGHGTHTLTTSAGNAGVAAEIYDIPRGEVSGIAPRAHVVAYKACGVDGCFGSDTTAAIQQAVADGVDVVNYSISGGNDPYADATSLAMLDAYNAGTLVVPSAGNSGPNPETVAHREPWSLTVGASTSDRHFISTVDLVADDGEVLQLEGASVTDGISTSTPVVLAPSIGCLTPFPPGTFDGEIVICERGGIARVAKSFNVAVGGAGGLLLYNPTAQGLSTDNHFIPSVHLENDSGDALTAFMGSHTGVTATFTQGVATQVQGDVMAPFSSRGGPAQPLGISKPDVTAPGVQILAGMTPLPEDQDGGAPGQLFQSIQGTSMSAPHATGAVALLRDARPDWDPGEVKSALMMSALTEGVTKEDGVTPADAFDFGSGRILPADAASATMTISATGDDFLSMADHLWDANYPSLYLPSLAGTITVERTITNQTDQAGVWKLRVDGPGDLGITVPTTVQADADGGTASFDIGVDGTALAPGEVRQATLVFEKTNQPNQGQQLHFPISVVKGTSTVGVAKTCEPAVIAKGDDTTCTITVQNNTFTEQDVSVRDEVPQQLNLDKGSVEGGTTSGNTVLFEGTLGGATPPSPSVAVDPLASPFGYVPLSPFGISDIGATDESITNFNVPAFEYAGVVYSQIGIVSNGYVVVGGGTQADVDFINTDLPAESLPNNVLAPFWTDLNPSAGGSVLVAVLTAGGNSWVVVEWESVPNWGDGETNTAQVWLGVAGDADPSEDISFTYGPDVSDGDSGFLTVGAENDSGTAGGTVYFDGAGTPPAPSSDGYEVAVTSVPGAPGESHTITFSASGKTVGTWVNHAELTGPGIAGTAVASFPGEVTR